MAIIYGRAIGGGGGLVPDIFGDGSDGDLVVTNGETHTETVDVPHQSIVEKKYNTLTIEAGGTYTTSACNAGLILRVKGDCTINGTIDQSGKAPKTNPNNTYGYPPELVCGAGGNGGSGNGSNGHHSAGGSAMASRPYGGGYGAGGGAASGNTWPGDEGGVGGDTVNTTIDVPDSQLFLKGTKGTTSTNAGAGQNGGGGGPALNADAYGGNGNYGGGVVLIFVGGTLTISGTINCSGNNGENGGNSSRNVGAGGGGGGGGGSIYIVHANSIQNTGNLTVNGGSAGPGGTGSFNGSPANGSPGIAGSIGTYTILSYDEYMQGQSA